MSSYIKLSKNLYPMSVDIIKDDPIAMLDYAFVYVDPIPEYDNTRYILIAKFPEQINEQWRQGWVLIPISNEENAKKIREQRNEKLAFCDWTQLADSTADKAAWAAYRQALRDVPLQTEFPWQITWPETP
jgi:hypothetical protein